MYLCMYVCVHIRMYVCHPLRSSQSKPGAHKITTSISLVTKPQYSNFLSGDKIPRTDFLTMVHTSHRITL